MKFISALLSAATLLLMASCTSPIVKRIERNPDLYNALSARHKALVQQGRVEEGMTKKAVFLSWGRPDRVAQGSKSGKAYETWIYTGYMPAYSMGFGNLYGDGSYGYGSPFLYDPMSNYGSCSPFLYDPITTYVPYEARRVQYLNGIVYAWSTSR